MNMPCGVSYTSNSSLAAAPVLVTADTDEALQRGRETVEQSGYRMAAAVSLSEASERLERQGAASAIWIEIGDGGDEVDVAIALAQHVSREGRCSAILSVPMHQLDQVSSLFDDANVEIVVDGNAHERASALALAVASRELPKRLHDAAADRNAERLRQLSDEVSRIASTLARLSTGPQPAPMLQAPPTSPDVPDISVDTVRTVIRARRLRSRFFPEELFADPAWDMLLDLLQAEIAQLRVPVSSLCIAAAVPATTALRWLKTMTDQGLFVRRADPHDGRRVFVELAPAASQSLRRYFAEVGQAATI
ncbi:winged helix-turn-helix transcriptional regulator [Sphingomonas piscis]|uniref:Winged helix-turn-helix transcriptional regulator n=1 Tax=Sphingomonas piscis TaxID=2714943 RepID=A0A6G7YRM8_9SPHN|nr:MarR family winged helix-turn-helix transcriptional regulator [Sphingomonas piscis]QIK79389.1 winged helix-turn-helix transcriptional regulator [Sphingomonas piscis]